MKKLFALLSLSMLTASAWAIDADTYYLYNVGAKKWLNFGNEKGMTATFYKTGTPIKVAASGEGYTLQCPFYDASNYLGASGSLTTATEFTITEVSKGIYTIQGTGGFLGYDGTTNLNAAPYSDKLVSCTLSDADSQNAQWQLFTKEALTARLKDASQKNPVDATFFIQSPNFHRHDAGCYNTSPNGNLVWTNMASTNHGYSGYTNNYNGFVFNTAGVNIYQDLTGLPAGIYEVRCQGFSRYGSNTDATGTYADTTPQATLYAGEVSTPFMKLTDDLAASGFYEKNKAYKDGYVPYFNNTDGATNSTSNTEAGKAFDYGMYNKNIVQTEVNDGTLRIGINVPSDARGNSWTAFDNFELIYYGALTSLTEEQISAILASVPTGKMEASLQTALDEALKAFNNDKSVENYNTLGSAISAAKASVEAYADVKAALDKADAEALGEAARTELDNAIADIRKAYNEGTIKGDGTSEVSAIEAAIKTAIAKDNEGKTDKTALITNPNFNDGKNGWSGDFGTGAVKATSINPLITAYGGTFDVYQDITGLENGTYKLQAQAFTRPMDHTDLKTAYANGEALSNESFLYANAQSTLVKLITEEYGTTDAWGAELATGKYIPNSSNDAAKAFNQGLYDNELLFIVKDGKARIGIKQLATDGKPYVGYDNFRLTYVSADTELPEKEVTRDDLLAILEGYKKVAVQALDHTAFDAVYAEVEAKVKAESETAPTRADLQPVHTALVSLLKTGETESGVFDLTPILTNTTFDKDIEGWTSDQGVFAWNSTGVLQVSNAKKTGRISQILKEMPAGKYTMKVQGFYRPKGWKQGLYEYEHRQSNADKEQASLYLNNSTNRVKSIFEDGRYTLASANISRTEDVGATIDGRGFPHLISKVGSMFSAGHYWNVIEQQTTADGDLELGLVLPEAPATNNWGVFDNIRLYYGTPKPIVLTSTNYSVKDDTRAEISIVKTLKADSLTAFYAPCDIDGSLFKAVYEVGSLSYTGKSASLYKVNKVRAGVPCYIIPAATTDTLKVGETLVRAATADNIVTPWSAEVLIPVAKSFNWKASAFNSSNKLTTLVASSIKTTDIQDVMDMNFTANIMNTQTRQFLGLKTYNQSTESAISTYNAPVPARRDVAHCVGIPVPATATTLTIGATELSVSPLGESEGARTPLVYIPNLIPDSTYTFEAVDAQGNVVSKGQFSVEGPHRMLYTPSIYNIRDFGGWTMTDGRRTRYGLIYRGGEVNGYHAPYQGDVETLKSLGIGAEIDLRYNDSYDQDRETGKSGFGFTKGDTYFFAGANDYTAANLDEAATQARLKQEFQFLLGHIREGRGVYFHCVFGADRTGFFAVLLEGLLGFKLDDLYKDYELTSFAAPAGNRNKSSIQERIAVIQKLSGSTLKAKFENYWLNKVGISQAEVDEFRSIMLYDPATVGVQPINLNDNTNLNGNANGNPVYYTLSGTRLPNVASKPGVYVVKYSNGKSRKVMVK